MNPTLGILDLEHGAQGRPALCVAAGPSFGHYLHLMARERVRERYVIIATLNNLKPMLAAGVRPHYVCYLDWSPLNARFIEGLNAADVEGVDLIWKPDANPNVVHGWPGRSRTINDGWLDGLLGDDAIFRGWLDCGATVSHMCHNLARFMRADPVIWVGLDLACPDGAYYGKGASIHQVWSSELNAFNTLEMMEHRRVRTHARVKVPRLGGGTVATDPQMANYAMGFARVFRQDADEGLTVIDVSRGGADKGNAANVTLDTALAMFRPDTPFIPSTGADSWRPGVPDAVAAA